MAATYSVVLGPGYGITFDGTVVADFGSSDLFDFEYTDQWSAVAIIKPSVVNIRQVILSNYDLATNQGWEWGIDADGRPYVTLRSSSTTYAKKNSPALSAGSEYALGMRYNGSGYATGIDLIQTGVLATGAITSETLGATTIVSTASRLQVGGRCGSNPLKATVEFVALIKKWLTLQEFNRYAFEAGYQ